ncbi:MAG: hypothetical protein F9K29_04115 [Hyphomicrobiaceae bacterium]|nr:MAG: hypothetical protein F9K29_04115 [Hyphomicrobiaceae bacterium]
MTAIVYAVPVFFALIAIEALVGLRRGRNTYRINDAVNSISLGILSQITAVFTRLIRIGIYAAVFQYVALFELSAGDWRVWIGALLLYDFCYYWHHRLGHECAIFWASHVVHHQSQDFNLSTALRQTSSGALLGWIFYLPMAILGVPPLVFAVVGLVDLLYQYWIHTEHIGKLGWFDRVFASPSNHRVHHAVNDKYLDKNYGGILIIWDRMFGTFVEEEETCVYGTRTQLNSWDPVWANLEVYAALIKSSWRARGAADKIRVWLKPPGWQPPDLEQPTDKPAFELSTVRLYNPAVSTGVGILSAVQLAALVVAACLFLLNAETLPLMHSGLIYTALVAGLWAIGGLLQKRLSLVEALFIEAAAITCLCQPLGWSELYLVMKPLSLSLAVLAALLRGGPTSMRVLLVLGLVASLAGDVLLMLPGQFVPGLAAFLTAHLLYIALMTRDAPLLPSRPAVAVVIAIAGSVLALIWPSLPSGLKAPVAAYVGVIALMAMQAIGRATVHRSGASIAVAAGALFFMASDTALAINKFVASDATLAALVLPTYYTAQALISFYVLPRPEVEPADMPPHPQLTAAAA